MSVGVASIPQTQCANGHELIAEADRALYASKRDGRNMVSMAQPKRESGAEENEHRPSVQKPQTTGRRVMG